MKYIKISVLVFLIMMLPLSSANADFDYADSPDFQLNLLSLPPSGTYSYFDSSSFNLDLYPVNRTWADSNTANLIIVRSLTVIVHGYSIDLFGDNPPAWAFNMGAAIENQQPQVSTWAYSWENLSTRGGKGWAESAGEKLAADIAQKIKDHGYDYLHMIGHSIGTVASSEAAVRLLRSGYPVNHMTFLDAVDGVVDVGGGVRDNPEVVAWQGIERIEHYWGNGNYLIIDYTPYLSEVSGGWNVGPTIDGFEYMNDYDHGQIMGYYQDTITGTIHDNGWHYSLLGGGWNDTNGRPGYRELLPTRSWIFNGDFSTQNWAGYVWEEEVSPGQWNYVEGFVNTTLVEREDTLGNYAARLDFDGSVPASLIHQEIIVPNNATILWVQVSENMEANSAFVVTFNGQQVGRIDYPVQTASDFHFLNFDIRPFAGEIGRFRFILDGYKSSQILIDNLDIGLCSSDLIADFDCSNSVDFSDLAYLTNRWLEDVPLLKEADLSGDAYVNFDDFVRFAQLWLAGISP